MRLIWHLWNPHTHTHIGVSAQDQTIRKLSSVKCSSICLTRSKWIIRLKITKPNKRFEQLFICKALMFPAYSKNNLFSSLTVLLKGLKHTNKEMEKLINLNKWLTRARLCSCKQFHQGANVVPLCLDFRRNSVFIFIRFVTKLSLWEILWKEIPKPHIYMFIHFPA